ncbi:MAG TPA: hypothetical protein VHV08_10270 [Pirellulales bacterium]|jgi:lipoate-protein ligase A|nr:hypothetical protein [Pirellulales bacterium]
MAKPLIDPKKVTNSEPGATLKRLALDCRVIVDAADGGAWQMAVDEVLLESAAAGLGATLRFYRWREPTLSLGYFQASADRSSHQASAACPLVRRQTGGGGIVHDQELTYSLALPRAHPLADDPTSLYRGVHLALVRVLGSFGISARLCEDRGPQAVGEQPFLCFERRAAGDVLVDSWKICGSAQRRRRGAILQHGSLLLAGSARAPQLPGLLELCNKSLPDSELIDRWRVELAESLRLNFHPGYLSAKEREAAGALAAAKYAAWDWTARR